MSLKDSSFQAVILTAVRDVVAEEVETARQDVKAELLAAFHDLGVKSVAVALPDGTPVATVTLNQPQPKPIVDEHSQLEWVRENHPSEVTEVVRGSFKTALDKRLKVVGDQVIDTRTGEVVPWATVRPAGEPRSFTLRYTADGREAIAQAWREGRMSIDGTARPELEGGTS